jgi:transposase InsO family protein
MDAATRLRRGESSYDIQRWLRRTDLTPRITRARNTGANGPIEKITWLDQSGDIVQIWTDRDLDGIADRVEIFAAGRRVQLIER